jgi:hypothetical protein
MNDLISTNSSIICGKCKNEYIQYYDNNKYKTCFECRGKVKVKVQQTKEKNRLKKIEPNGITNYFPDIDPDVIIYIINFAYTTNKKTYNTLRKVCKSFNNCIYDYGKYLSKLEDIPKIESLLYINSINKSIGCMKGEQKYGIPSSVLSMIPHPLMESDCILQMIKFYKTHAGMLKFKNDILTYKTPPEVNKSRRLTNREKLSVYFIGRVMRHYLNNDSKIDYSV